MVRVRAAAGDGIGLLEAIYALERFHETWVPGVFEVALGLPGYRQGASLVLYAVVEERLTGHALHAVNGGTLAHDRLALVERHGSVGVGPNSTGCDTVVHWPDFDRPMTLEASLDGVEGDSQRRWSSPGGLSGHGATTNLGSFESHGSF